jgi:hypothetical protein
MITKINIEGNPVAKSNPNYKDELFKLIPSLNIIDKTNKEGKEIESTIYGEEEEEEEDDNDFDGGEGEEIDEDVVSGEDFEDEYGEEDDEDDEDEENEKPNKRPKH